MPAPSLTVLNSIHPTRVVSPRPLLRTKSSKGEFVEVFSPFTISSLGPILNKMLCIQNCRWTEAMQLMTEGDKWELYIPSELAYGDRGSPPNIPGDSALVFTIEMITIQGEKVIALKCNPSTLEECDAKMIAYINKAKTKFGGDGDELEEEIARLMKMTKGGGMKDELKAWFDTRVFLLQQMLLNSNSKEEL